jgi:hypothetical protein
VKKKLLRIQSLPFALLIAALVGAFVLGKCSTSKPPEETVPEVTTCPEQTTEKEQEKEQMVVDNKDIRFDAQCLEDSLNRQCTESFLFFLKMGGVQGYMENLMTRNFQNALLSC